MRKPPFNIHEACHREIDFWRDRAVAMQAPSIKQVIRQSEGKHLEVMKIIRIDIFHDGLRILVE